MVEVECPKCKILVDIPKGIDTNHYDGIIPESVKYTHNV